MRGIYLGNNRVLVAPVWGGKLLALADDLSLTPELIMHGVVEPALTVFLLQRIRPGQTVVDVGANIGYFTVLLGALVGPSGRVFACEANPEVLPLLRENVAFNYFSDYTTIIPKAAYSKTTTLPFYRTRRFVGNASLHPHPDAYRQIDEVETTQVEAEPLDRLLAEVSRIDLIKMDIEGGEYQAFLGLREALQRKAVGTVVFELNRGMLQGDWEPFCAWLLQAQAEGARFWTLDEGGNAIPLALASFLAETGGFNRLVVMEP